MDVQEKLRIALNYRREGRFQRAESTYKEILKFDPYNFHVLNYLGNVFQEQHKYDEAINCYQEAIRFNPSFAGSYYHLGSVFEEEGQYDKAIKYYQEAIQYDPNFAGSYNNLGNVFKKIGQEDSAILYFQKAIEVNPNFWGSYYNLGEVLQNRGMSDKAIFYFQKTLQLNPTHIASYNNLGNCLQAKEKVDEAITCYQKAIQIQPNVAESYYNLGSAFLYKGEHDEVAIACFKKALEINPEFAEAYAHLAFQMQETCSWRELKAMTANLDSLTRQALETGTKPAESPFMSIARNADPPLNFAIAKSWSLNIAKAMSNLKIRFSRDGKRTCKTKIIIGYISNDFRNHATAHLMRSLFGLHRRDEFQIYCYSYGRDDGSSYGARIKHDCDKFVDISGLDCADAAKCINEDQVDILVDLKGYTRGNRLAICAFRPAPVQISYLGFPGTTGADFFDYIITDKIVTPQDLYPCYTEKFVFMPYCYQVNDHTQTISPKVWEKRDLGLPESCFVFCSFNQPYKIDPVMFDIWMRIMKQVPESILWLGLGNRLAEVNLKRESEARGVKAERLIFAENLPKDEHLGRLRFAGLALDTRIVNGHTTTSDALWSGVPVLTLQGSHFASRVSSSILSAMDLPELITYSTEEYETLAVRLACDSVKLKEIRQKIAKNRLTTPLFDTPRFVRNLETAYKEIWKLFLAGNAPRQIEVLED
ncbi:MAG: tetratricopeptide repeat protein [Nitrospirota bacterium]